MGFQPGFRGLLDEKSSWEQQAGVRLLGYAGPTGIYDLLLNPFPKTKRPLVELGSAFALLRVTQRVLSDAPKDGKRHTLRA